MPPCWSRRSSTSSLATRPCCGRAGCGERRSHADLSKICSLYEDAVPTWEPRPFIIQRPAETCPRWFHGDADRGGQCRPVPGELGQRQTHGTQHGGRSLPHLPARPHGAEAVLPHSWGSLHTQPVGRLGGRSGGTDRQRPHAPPGSHSAGPPGEPTPGGTGVRADALVWGIRFPVLESEIRLLRCGGKGGHPVGRGKLPTLGPPGGGRAQPPHQLPGGTSQ